MGRGDDALHQIAAEEKKKTMEEECNRSGCNNSAEL
jgi:hypothetical protein